MTDYKVIADSLNKINPPLEIPAGQSNGIHIQDYEQCSYLTVSARGVKIQS